MKEIITSVGIDIGTSTTQLIFSHLTIENRAGSYAVPRIDIVDKEVFYRSDIYLTPLLSNTEIDAGKVQSIVRGEYHKAGISPEDVHTGAVIITGEAARKDNADTVLAALSSMAGDFVVATAGPDLESVLSARGAGADRLSEENRETVANLDVGGGTTNIAVYGKGTLRATSCLDIGGRLIKTENGRISYIFPKIQELARSCGISVAVGDPADTEILRRVADQMAEQLAQAVGLLLRDNSHNGLYTNAGKPLPADLEIHALTFSGGVADLIEEPASGDNFRYGDIGVLLGRAIALNPAFRSIRRYQAAETIRATVVGAGTHTTEVSGSTIAYSQGMLPVKNIPILRVSEEDEATLASFCASVRAQMPLYLPDGRPEQIAIAFKGKTRTSFLDVQALAKAILESAEEVINSTYPLIVVVETDIAKALGNALQVLLGPKKGVICIDSIKTLSGDYIDIGEPVAGGQVVPVVIKTLIFNS